ncbi:MAG: diacylglycerol kinase family lipid kinase [Polyangiales bacterium]
MPISVIVNPASRGGWVSRNWLELEAMLRRELGDVTVHRTERPGHGRMLAKQAVDAGATTLVSFGGDGTHSEVVSGIVDAGDAGKNVTLGILHAGTGGDFRKLLLASEDLAASCRVIVEKEASPIDAGEVTFEAHSGAPETRVFLNIASLGMGGLVDQYVAGQSKKLPGKANYFLASVRAFFGYTPATVDVDVDGKRMGSFTISNLCVCNGQYAGGGMHFAPNARLADGLFDVVVLEHAPLAKSLGVAKGLYDGSHVRSPLVHVTQGKHVVVAPTTPARAWMDIDGEAPGFAPAEFKVLPKALRVHGVRPEFR